MSVDRVSLPVHHVESSIPGKEVKGEGVKVLLTYYVAPDADKCQAVLAYVSQKLGKPIDELFYSDIYSVIGSAGIKKEGKLPDGTSFVEFSEQAIQEALDHGGAANGLLPTFDEKALTGNAQSKVQVYQLIDYARSQYVKKYGPQSQVLPVINSKPFSPEAKKLVEAVFGIPAEQLTEGHLEVLKSMGLIEISGSQICVTNKGNAFVKSLNVGSIGGLIPDASLSGLTEVELLTADNVSFYFSPDGKSYSATYNQFSNKDTKEKKGTERLRRDAEEFAQKMSKKESIPPQSLPSHLKKSPEAQKLIDSLFDKSYSDVVELNTAILLGLVKIENGNVVLTDRGKVYMANIAEMDQAKVEKTEKSEKDKKKGEFLSNLEILSDPFAKEFMDNMEKDGIKNNGRYSFHGQSHSGLHRLANATDKDLEEYMKNSEFKDMYPPDWLERMKKARDAAKNILAIDGQYPEFLQEVTSLNGKDGVDIIEGKKDGIDEIDAYLLRNGKTPYSQKMNIADADMRSKVVVSYNHSYAYKTLESTFYALYCSSKESISKYNAKL